VCQTPTIPWLNLGVQPLANGFYRDPTELRYYPLVVVRCPACALSQLTEVVPPEVLYTNYVYRSGVSVTFNQHCAELAAEISAMFPHKGQALDIASNDGTLVDKLARYGFAAIGVDPSQNLVDVAHAWGRKAWCGYFPEATDNWPSGITQVITSLNVLGHVADVHAFAAEVARLLTGDGVWVVEVPWVRELLRGAEFDTIYHEHLSYWSLSALRRLGAAHGMGVIRIHFQPIHGGSVRVYFRKGATSIPEWAEDSLLDPATYDSFKIRMDRRVARFWRQYRGMEGSWAGYGAAAKGTVFAEVAGIGPDHLAFVVDETPEKQGLFTPYGVPVVPPRTAMTDNVLIFPWNFETEIRAKLPSEVKVLSTR
jgi:SAM-dependent methyltransferase